jgi:hypothetical protein
MKNESMVSSGHYNALKLERDELGAQADRLRDALHNSLQCWQYDGVSDEHGSVFQESDKRCDEAETQSLLIHDAELMEREAKAWLRDGNATSMYLGKNVNCVLSARARELRNEAEGKA